MKQNDNLSLSNMEYKINRAECYFRAKAKSYIPARVSYYARQMKVSYGKITIRKRVVEMSYGRRKIFTDEAEITAENVPKQKKVTDIEIQESQRTPNKLNPNRCTPRHIQ